VRSLPHPARGVDRAGHRSRPAAVPAEPRSQPPRRTCVCRGWPGPRDAGCVSSPGVEADDTTARRRRPIWREIVYIVGVYLVYSTVRNRFGSAGGEPGHANGISFGHALDIIDLERNLHLFFEARIQDWYLGLPAH